MPPSPLSRAMLLLALAAPVVAEAARPVAECAAAIPSGTSAFQIGALGSSAEMLAAAARAVPAICRNLLAQEAQGSRGALANNCLLTDEAAWDDARGLLKPRQALGDAERARADALQARCEQALSAEDVARRNRDFSGVYRDMQGREQAAAARARAQAAATARLETARATERDFDLKGLRLGQTPAEVQAQDPLARFQCEPDARTTLASHCRARFSQRLCETQELVHPVSGEPLLDAFGKPRMIERCEQRFPAGTPSRLGTFGGARVHAVAVTYYDAVAGALELSLASVPAELVAALHEKFGAPDIADREHEEWLGKDASLAVWPRSGRVLLQRPSVQSALDKAGAEQAAAARMEAESAARARQSGRVQDL